MESTHRGEYSVTLHRLTRFSKTEDIPELDLSPRDYCTEMLLVAQNEKCRGSELNGSKNGECYYAEEK